MQCVWAALFTAKYVRKQTFHRSRSPKAVVLPATYSDAVTVATCSGSGTWVERVSAWVRVLGK